MIAFIDTGLCRAQPRFAFVNPGTKRYSLQAKIIRNLFVIQVFINDDGPYNFVLDTGSGLTLITDSVLRTKLQLVHGTNVKVYGAGNNVPIDALLTDRLSFR